MRIGVLTSSRADFGIYLPLLKALQKDASFSLDLIAFGTHLSSFHGYTLNQIEQEGFKVNYKIESMLISDSRESIATSMSLTLMKFTSFWQSHYNDFDLVFCLGDRYEMFSAVMAGVPFQIKFAHIHGGEKTLGAIDNVFRHSISHASKYHFTATEEYRTRIRSMVDEPDHVYYTGALSLDNLESVPLLSKAEFFDLWKVDLERPTVLTTFQPETINVELNVPYALELVKAIGFFKNYQFLITMPNSDTSGNTIRKIFEESFANQPGIFLIENLGTRSYFTAMKYCRFLLGNTSSGIIEAASFGKYVINLGSRQDGRSRSENIIQSDVSLDAIKQAVSDLEARGEFTGKNLYFKAGAADTIIQILKDDFFHEQ